MTFVPPAGVPPPRPPMPANRIWTAAEQVDPAMQRPIRGVYADQDLMTLVEWAPPGQWSEPPHTHPESAHVFLVVEGEGEALVDGKWEKIRAGQFIVQPRNKVHAMRNPSQDKAFVWVCVSLSKGRYVVEDRPETYRDPPTPAS